MIRIVIGGLQKELIKRTIEANADEGQVEAIISSDFEGAKMVKQNKADYYFGACNSGGGAALSVAIGLLGYTNCSTVATAGGRPNPQKIDQLVQDGKVAFGMSVETIEETVPYLIQSILKSKQ